MIRLEAWTPPGSGDFHKKIETVPVITASGTKSFRGQGSGRMVCAEEFEELPLLVDSLPGFPEDDVATLIRVWDDEVHVMDWLLEPSSQSLDEDGLIELGGPDAKAMFAWAYVECQDWNGDAVFTTRDPDWIYGGQNLLGNWSFEDAPLALANPGFEDGTREPWWPGAVEGYSANAEVFNPITDVGLWSLRVDPLVAEGGASTTVRLFPANFYTITARVRGKLGKSYEIGASGPPAIVAVAGSSGKVDHTEGGTPGGWEVQQTFVGTGAFQTVTMIFGTAGDQNSSQISIREAAPFDGDYFYIDNVSIVGFGIGMSPWRPTGDNQPDIAGPVSAFEVSNAQSTDGSWSGFVTAVNSHGMFQELDGITPGTQYTAEVNVGHASSAAPVAIVVLDVKGNMLGTEWATVPTGAWTTIQVTFRTPDFLPGPRGTVRFKVVNISGGTLSWYVDEAQLYKGFPPSTAGTILNDQRESLDLRGALPFITYDFSDTLDSAGNAWDALLTHTIKHGGTDQQQVLEAFEKMGYEARLVVDDYTTGTYLLQVYNPSGMGTDYSGGEPSILVGQGVVAGDVTRRHAAFNAVQALSKEGSTTRVTSAGSETAIGRRERLFYDQTIDAGFHAAAKLADGLAQGLTSGLTILGDPGAKPFRDFDVADTIDWNLADDNGWTTQRVGSINYVEDANHLRYSLYPDVETFSGGGAVAEGIRQLLADRKLPHDHILALVNDDVPPIRSSGTPTIVVAAVDASTFSLSRADYFCTGVDDDDTIQVALDQLALTGGRIVLTEGTFSFGATGLTLPTSDVTLEGLGIDQTTLLATVVVSSMIKNDSSVGQSKFQRIQDLTIDGNDFAVYGILSPQACQIFMEVDRVRIMDCTSNGVNLSRPAGWWRFRRCQFVGNNGNGVQGREADQSFFDCLFYANSTGGLGIQQDGTGHIEGCFFWSNGGAAIASGNAISQGFSNFIITSNIFISNTGLAISIQDGDNNLIANNIFSGNSGSISFGAGAFGVANNGLVIGNIHVAGSGTFVNISSGSSAHQAVNVVDGVLQVGSTLESMFATVTSPFSQAGVLTTGTGSFKLPWTTSGTITGVRAAVGVAPTGAAIIVDVNKNGTSIFSSSANQPTIPAGSTVGAEATTIATTTMVGGDYLTVDIDQVGSTVAGEDLTVVVEWKVTA